MLYADVIVNISHENIDKTYQYRVPESLTKAVGYGTPVRIPFGRGSRSIKGYVVGFSEKPSIAVERIKEIEAVIADGVVVESQLIALAWWIKETYGSTMNDALKTVLPVKEMVRAKEKTWIFLEKSREQTEDFLQKCRKKNNKGRVRLLEALLLKEPMELSQAASCLGIARTTLKDMEGLGYIRLDKERIYRNPILTEQKSEKKITLKEDQRRIADIMIEEWESGQRETYLLHGVTGSGKTEVYLEVIEAVLKQGQQVIMLIPEIALTFQTVLRFYQRLGEQVSVLHSRMSKGERYDQYIRAKNGEISVIIGPRSALFVPFEKLGLIIIDEEHEGSYKSEGTPKYHARETAIERARLQGASVILGSATPSLESYYKAKKGEYRLFTLQKRAGDGVLPMVHITDLREELKKGNKSIFGELLHKKLEERLEKKEQSMLFINRRGYAGFVSCRSCGYVVKCPHCDVSLTFHQPGYQKGRLKCHYCGYETAMPERCPECGSPYIAAFGTGTQKIEELLKREFPNARVLRMDMDTTRGKDGHEKILSAFMQHKADILVGTQMIVKGHDFSEVTLVGVLAADLSLYAGDFRSSERTFQLLCQAAGRAGRGKKPGEVVIQTYNPEHYSIVTAAQQDYPAFYEKEILYRSMASYPPVSHMLVVFVTAGEEELAIRGAKALRELTEKELLQPEQVEFIGPAAATVGKVKDIYRQVLYLKSADHKILKEIRSFMEGYLSCTEEFKRLNVQFDFDPMFHY